jgi:TonB family protein
VAKKVDIETRIHLRSGIKPDATPILKAIAAALFVHALFWFNWPVEKKSTAVEIPDWINIKLTAGFEIKENKVEKIKNQKIIETPTNKENILSEKNKIEHNIKKRESKPSPSTTFIAADSRPYQLENPKPVYPTAARRRGMQGVVLLSVNISETGYVKEINILQTSGFRVLDQSALKSVKHWRFIPARQGEKKIASKIEVPIRFILNET